jgi:hypothetical protein
MIGQSIADGLKAAASYMNLQHRPALAIVVACALLIVATLVGWTPAPLGAIWYFVVPVVGFAGTMYLYPRNAAEKWAAQKRHRRRATAALVALDHLSATERQSIEFIFHHGGRYRADMRFRPLVELERLNVLEQLDPYSTANERVMRLPPPIYRRLRWKLGRPTPSKASGDPPWQIPERHGRV